MRHPTSVSEKFEIAFFPLPYCRSVPVDLEIRRSLFIFQQGIETREWVVRRNLLLRAARRRFVRPISHQMPRVLIVVTVKTQQLPVAAVRRIVFVVVILVVDGELPQSLALEFAPAAPTNCWKYFERLLAIALHPNLSFASSLSNELIPPVAIWPRIVW